jgi:uncharacterized protein YraI
MRLKLITAASVAALALFAASSALAATVNTPVNVREEPDPEAEILGVLQVGAEVECTDMIGNWCELADGEGYVYAAYLDFDEDGDDDDDDDDDVDDDDDDVDIDIDFGGDDDY